MKVPEEFVDAMLRAGGGSIQRWRMERALQAVLPLVRERLVSEAGDPGWGLTEDAHDDIGAIFDAALPDSVDEAEGQGRR